MTDNPSTFHEEIKLLIAKAILQAYVAPLCSIERRDPPSSLVGKFFAKMFSTGRERCGPEGKFFVRRGSAPPL